MKEEIKNLWVEALRSGRYKQGKWSLRVKECYCCLGVLCDLSKLHKWRLSSVPDQYFYNVETGGLPPSVMSWAGMNTHFGKYKIVHQLTRDNDEGKSFNEIADIIEANWKEL